MRTMSRWALAFAFVAASATALEAQDTSWRGRIAAGRVLEVRGVNGDVRATPASGNEAEVTWEKVGRRSDPEEVEIKVIEHSGGVLICAVYPTPPRARHENECSPDGNHMSTDNNDVRVTFHVRVPANIVFDGRTVNGDVEAEDLAGDVDLSTVNGSVRLSTAGRGEASTVNGSIDARVGKADWSGDADFKTVNGGITLTLPASLSAEVRAETVNGDIESEFPLTVQGRFGPRRVRGTIGNGGRTLDLGTVNGSIRLRKGS